MLTDHIPLIIIVRLFHCLHIKSKGAIMTYTEEQLDAMSGKVGSVLGERLNYLSRGQENSLEFALLSLFEDHNGQAKNIPDEEIWGA